MSHTQLLRPSVDRFVAWQACVTEFADGPMDGSGSWMVSDFAADRRSFEVLLNQADGQAYRQNTGSAGHVPCSWFWITDPDEPGEVLGFLALRHNLDNEFLARVGGHIGYSVRPSRRRRGHAGRALVLALTEARRLGLDRVLVTCHESNVASAGVIEQSGGVFESSVEGHRRYWITLPPLT